MIQRSLEKKRSGQGGFTLVELLIVIVILGILAAIVVLAIGGLKGTSQTQACKSEMQTIETAQDAYFASNGATGYATSAQLYTAGSATNLLKSDPVPHFTINSTGTPGYTIAGANACAGTNAGYPTAAG
ncbi:MAG: ral secretion pathway protein [Actinomycetia bacterium]|jgi:prepilin-type N-terminal cleavage/methylation domain-containing protein|nr:ral secretion pathway protein [Actinomycetes bacterium]